MSSSNQPAGQCKQSMDNFDFGRIFTIDQASGEKLACIKTDVDTSVCTPGLIIGDVMKARGGVWCKENKDGVRVCSVLKDKCENTPFSM